MPERSPTAPGLQLATALSTMRKRVGWNRATCATALGVTVATYGKYEQGTLTIPQGNLIALLSLWQRVVGKDGKALLVLTEQDEKQFLALRHQAEQPVWWSEYDLTENLSQFLGFESMARRIDAFEANLMFGPWQTQEYSYHVVRALEPPDATDDDIAKLVRLRMERQERVYGVDHPPSLRIILDEPVVRRCIGGPEVMAEQLKVLTRLRDEWEVRILPLDAAPHPGMKGSFCLLRFDEHVRDPAIYVESVQQNFYLDTPPRVRQASVDHKRLWDAAYSRDDTQSLIRSIVEELVHRVG